MRFPQVLSALLLVAYLPSCTSWQATTEPIPQLTAPPKPVPKLRITTTAGTRLEVWAPTVASDTLKGVTPKATTGAKADTVRAIPLTSITKVEVHKVDGLATAFAVLGGMVVIGGIAGAIALDNSCLGVFCQ